MRVGARSPRPPFKGARPPRSPSASARSPHRSCVPDRSCAPVGCEAHEAALHAPGHADLALSFIFCLLSLTPDATNTNGYPVDCYPCDCYPFDGYSFDGYPIKPYHSHHTHSIFCLLSLTPDATVAMRFCSRFILSIRTRRHLVLTQPRGEGKNPSPPKTPPDTPDASAALA